MHRGRVIQCIEPRGINILKTKNGSALLCTQGTDNIQQHTAMLTGSQSLVQALHKRRFMDKTKAADWMDICKVFLHQPVNKRGTGKIG